MRKILTVILIFLTLTGSVHATDISDELYEQLPLADLEEAVPEEAERFMNGISPMQPIDFMSGIKSVFEQAIHQSKNSFGKNLHTMLRIIIVLILCQLTEAVFGGERQRIVVWTGVVALMMLCLTDLNTMIGLGTHTIQSLSQFSELLLPVMAAAASASGNVSGGSCLYTVSIFFFHMLVKLGEQFIHPVILAYIGISAADTLIQGEKLKGLNELLVLLIEKGIKGIVFLFTGSLTITGILSGTADAAALKATKSAITMIIPVVGSMIANASETVLHAGMLVKTTIGTWGLVVVMAILLLPFIQLAISWLTFKITAAMGSIMGVGFSKLLNSISRAMGIILGLVGSCGLIVMISCCCMIKMVSL